MLIRHEPGAYPLQVSGACDATGLALNEIYEMPDRAGFDLAHANPQLLTKPCTPSMAKRPALLLAGAVLQGRSERVGRTRASWRRRLCG